MLATIIVTENPFIQRHVGQNGSVSISLSDNDKTSIAPIIPIDQIYKLNSFFVNVIDQKSRVVEFTNDKFSDRFNPIMPGLFQAPRSPPPMITFDRYTIKS